LKRPSRRANVAKRAADQPRSAGPATSSSQSQAAVGVG
jgi:hypothetical protein